MFSISIAVNGLHNDGSCAIEDDDVVKTVEVTMLRRAGMAGGCGDVVFTTDMDIFCDDEH
jgi:hypothetical protein